MNNYQEYLFQEIDSIINMVKMGTNDRAVEPIDDQQHDKFSYLRYIASQIYKKKCRNPNNSQSTIFVEYVLTHINNEYGQYIANGYMYTTKVVKHYDDQCLSFYIETEEENPVLVPNSIKASEPLFFIYPGEIKGHDIYVRYRIYAIDLTAIFYHNFNCRRLTHGNDLDELLRVYSDDYNPNKYYFRALVIRPIAALEDHVYFYNYMEPLSSAVSYGYGTTSK